MHAGAILRGCVLAWLVGTIVLAGGSDAPTPARFESFMFIAKMGLVFAVPATVVALIGAWIAATSRLTVPWWATACGGTVCSVIFAAWIASPIAFPKADSNDVVLSGFILGFGAATATVAWLGAFGLRARIAFGLERF